MLVTAVCRFLLFMRNIASRNAMATTAIIAPIKSHGVEEVGCVVGGGVEGEDALAKTAKRLKW